MLAVRLSPFHRAKGDTWLVVTGDPEFVSRKAAKEECCGLDSWRLGVNLFSLLVSATVHRAGNPSKKKPQSILGRSAVLPIASVAQ